ncbi:MAG TPA: hypothetical protein VFN53_10265 [Acidobacteriaceae bacterium]|nr:hypothetical protein [Acidobacteriaceae bacterium]
MNLFCFLPQAARRLKLGVSLCAVLMSMTLVGLAQTGGDNTGGNSGGNTPINNPKLHDISNGNYDPTPPPSGPDVYFNRRWDLYTGLAYTNFLAGPALIQRSNMGGFDAAGTYWLNWHWGIQGSARMYIGTSGVFPNEEHGFNPPPCKPFEQTCYESNNITGPRIMQYYFLAGPQYRFLRKTKFSATAHTLFGNAYGVFDSANLQGLNVQTIGLFATQWTFGGAIGGSFDYNYTPRIGLRIQPDLMLTHYGGTAQQNFAFSVGPIFRFGKLDTSAVQPRNAKASHHFGNPFRR